ncbi:unnamed protein product [Aspergillus oryzae]|uniref:Unnamed protein product n=1 Tax=Aspergillus oryzae var. brunneus TaxID=332754 RepID=A0ABQ6L0J1_ASPOZ|nr:unnamed protein product [Aspergillus oryzae]GMF89747.1 unnamed protein product [Aspergillus oryzae]GMG51391.1 unnamed protein product [Aspergillus oryzae var. brunneus]
MSERGSFRGGRGRGGGHDRSGGRGGHAKSGGASGGAQQQEKPKKENILDLSKYMDKEVRVKFNGGREVVGTLKGFDQLMNLVLDDVKESMRVKRLPTPSCKRRSKRTLIRRTALAILDYQSCIWSLRISRRVPYSHAIPITAIAEFTLLTFACLDWCQSTYLTIPSISQLASSPHGESLSISAKADAGVST